MGVQTGRDFVKTLHIGRCESTKSNMAPHPPRKNMRMNSVTEHQLQVDSASEVALQRLAQHGLQLLDGLLALMLHFLTFI